MQHFSLFNHIANFNTFLFLLFREPALTNAHFYSAPCENKLILVGVHTHKHASTHTHQSWTLAQPCASGPLNQSCETTRSFLQIRLHLQAEVCKSTHITLGAQAHTTHAA